MLACCQVGLAKEDAPDPVMRRHNMHHCFRRQILMADPQCTFRGGKPAYGMAASCATQG